MRVIRGSWLDTGDKAKPAYRAGDQQALQDMLPGLVDIRVDYMGGEGTAAGGRLDVDIPAYLTHPYGFALDTKRCQPQPQMVALQDRIAGALQCEVLWPVHEIQRAYRCHRVGCPGYRRPYHAAYRVKVDDIGKRPTGPGQGRHDVAGTANQHQVHRVASHLAVLAGHAAGQGAQCFPQLPHVQLRLLGACVNRCRIEALEIEIPFRQGDGKAKVQYVPPADQGYCEVATTLVPGCQHVTLGHFPGPGFQGYGQVAKMRCEARLVLPYQRREKQHCRFIRSEIIRVQRSYHQPAAVCGAIFHSQPDGLQANGAEIHAVQGCGLVIAEYPRGDGGAALGLRLDPGGVRPLPQGLWFERRAGRQ